MLWLDSQIGEMKLQIIQRKIRKIIKTMGKPDTSLIKKAQNLCIAAHLKEVKGGQKESRGFKGSHWE